MPTPKHRPFFVRPSIRKPSKRNHSTSSSYLHPYTPPSQTMSSITPPSFIDDGTSFAKRTPHRLANHHIAKWISSAGSDASGYTGSYIDDGADMHVPQGEAPGFGTIDTTFYKQRKRQGGESGEVWNDDVQKAVSGDVGRNMERVRRWGDMRVRKGSSGEMGRDGKEKDTITVPVPLQWGTFIIKGEDGRVIVVDEDGEFDSGPRGKRRQEVGRWVRAASTASKEKEKEKKIYRQKTSRPHHPLSPSKILTPIPESEYESGYLPSNGQDIGSPTNFLMTGGASGWPERTSSPALSVSEGYEYIVPASPVRSISEIYRHVPARTSNSSAWDYEAPGVTSLPGSYPKKSSVESWGAWKEGSETSGKSHKSRPSMKSYKAPTVEDAPSSSSGEKEKEDYPETWGGSVKNNEKAMSPTDTWTHDLNTTWQDPLKHIPSHAHVHSRPGSETSASRSWSSRLKAADSPSWTGIQIQGSPQLGSPARPASEATWDGFERVKTMSDVSVVGSGSEVGSRRSKTSKRSSRYGWEGSQASHRSRKFEEQTSGWPAVSEQSWGSEKARVDDDTWAGSEGGSGAGVSKYKNGFDEDNETYLNDNWGGVPVRVGGRVGKESVVGWET